MDALAAIGLKGLQDGSAQAAEAAARISRAFLPNYQEDAVNAMVDLNSAARQVQASAAVVRTADELAGYVLDIMA
jgi:hypothetical protein